MVIADDGSNDGTRQWLSSMPQSEGLHVITNERRYAVGQSNTILDHLSSRPYDIAFMVDDDIVFLKPGWDTAYIEAIHTSGFEHLCWFSRSLWRTRYPHAAAPLAQTDKTGRLKGYVPPDQALGALFTITPRIVEKVGWFDENSFPIRGQWHGDYSTRCARAGFNDPARLFDIGEGEEFISVQDLLDPGYRRADRIAASERPLSESPDERQRRQAIIADPTRVFVSAKQAGYAANETKSK